MGKSFAELKIAGSILRPLGTMGINIPTPVQEQAIPRINSGANVVCIAQTGTGKTAAYLLPLLSRLIKPVGKEPRVLILVPTRELSMQVGEDLARMTTLSELRYAAVYGGIGLTIHIALIEPGVDILVATPGRLSDLYKSGALSLKMVKYLVIDEADRMLDMGFMPQLRRLFEIIPSKRQNLLFSATFSDRVETLAEEFLDFYEKVEVAPSATPADKVNQVIYKVSNSRTKLSLIEHLMRDESDFNRIIIFVKTKEQADNIFKFIKRKSAGEVRILHSNKTQTFRINSIEAFKRGEVRTLITTDIASRGIDASMVSHVINFDVPQNYDDYVHRIGRTARAGNRGDAITLIDPSEEWHWKRIEELIRMRIPPSEIPPGTELFETGEEERQRQLREIDRQRKIDDPDFQGAFHEPKKRRRSLSRAKGRPGKRVSRKRRSDKRR